MLRRVSAIWLSIGWLTHPYLSYAKQLPVKTYTTADGLPRDRVSCIVPDSRGYIWFCTAEGLSRFDGYRFTTYSVKEGLPHRFVNHVLELRNGLYLIATARGLARFNPALPLGSAGSLVSWHIPEADGLDVATVLFQDRKGEIWCGTPTGLYQIEGVETSQPKFQFVDLGMPKSTSDDRVVQDLLEDRSGVLWIASGSGLYRRWPTGRIDRFTTRFGLPKD